MRPASSFVLLLLGLAMVPPMGCSSAPRTLADAGAPVYLPAPATITPNPWSRAA